MKFTNENPFLKFYESYSDEVDRMISEMNERQKEALMDLEIHQILSEIIRRINDLNKSNHEAKAKMAKWLGLGPSKFPQN